MALKCFFDGGNQADSRLYDVVNLAAVSGSPTQWRVFDSEWKLLLKRHDAPYLHTTDVLTLNDPFTKENGWNHKKAELFLRDCAAVAEKCTIKPWVKRGIIPHVATIVLADFLRARTVNPKLPSDVNVLCATQSVDHVVAQGVQFGFTQFELTFDQNEPFAGHIMHRQQNKKARRDLKAILDRIISVGVADTRQVMALQLADLYAWCFSHKNEKKRKTWHNRILNQRKWVSDWYAYDAIVNTRPGVPELVASWNLPPTKATR